MAAFPNDLDPAAENGWKVLLLGEPAEARQRVCSRLAELRIDGRGLVWLTATNAAEALSTLQHHADVALLLLVMPAEGAPAVADLLHRVREELGCRRLRIVLVDRGMVVAADPRRFAALEVDAVIGAAADDAATWRDVVAAAVRGYRDLATPRSSREDLERVLRASAEVGAQRDPDAFGASVLDQLAHLVPAARGLLLCRVEHTVGSRYRYPILLADPAQAHLVGRSAEEVLPLPRMESLHRALRKRRHVFSDDHFVLHFIDAEERESLLCVADCAALDEAGRMLVQLFGNHVAGAWENLHLTRDLVDSQLEMIWLLAGAAETRSRETANHVKRVGLMAEMLARAYGLDAKAAQALRMAAPLHDIGKIGIPDAILNKPGPHTPEEALVMRSHARLGAQLLSSSRRPLLQLAAQICLEHHENWDGSGYPAGLAGEDISLAGRIVALSDVFDALGSQRCYKDPWSLVRIREHVADQAGRKFDPRLVTLLFEHWSAAERLRDEFPD